MEKTGHYRLCYELDKRGFAHHDEQTPVRRQAAVRYAEQSAHRGLIVPLI